VHRHKADMWQISQEKVVTSRPENVAIISARWNADFILKLWQKK